MRRRRRDFRRWNWRQGRRTQLREDTTTALFILDALDPMTSGALDATADDLIARLTRLGPASRRPAACSLRARPPGTTDTGSFRSPPACGPRSRWYSSRILVTC